MSPVGSKIRVEPEGREGGWIPEKESLIEWLEDRWANHQLDNAIHSFAGGNGLLIGADWSLQHLIEEIRKADRVGLLTGDAALGNLRHALSVIVGNRLLMFDIGDVTDEIEVSS